MRPHHLSGRASQEMWQNVAPNDRETRNARAPKITPLPYSPKKQKILKT